MKILNKYIVLLILWSIVSMAWIYIQPIFMRKGILSSTDFESYSLINSLPTYIDYIIRIIIVILLAIDFKRHKLNYIVLTCIATLFYPLLGIVILSLLLIEKRKVLFEKELVHSFKKLPDTNSYFLEKITSGMVQSNHMKFKKNLSRTLHTLYQFRKAFWNLSEKSNFLKKRHGVFSKSCSFLRDFKKLYGTDKEYVVCGTNFFPTSYD